MKNKFETLLREAGINPALPHLIFSKKEGILHASKRMCILLGVYEEQLIGIKQKAASEHWPFANTEDAGPKLFTKLVSEAIKNETFQVEAQTQLKNYKLNAQHLLGVGVVITATLMRKGDLLRDMDSRQELFRTLAHEIRTTTTALEGYVNIVADKDFDQDDLKKRMLGVIKRLHKNVELLDSLRQELSKDEAA